MWHTEEDKIITIRKIRKGSLEEYPSQTLKDVQVGNMFITKDIAVQKVQDQKKHGI